MPAFSMSRWSSLGTGSGPDSEKPWGSAGVGVGDGAEANRQVTKRLASLPRNHRRLMADISVQGRRTG